ncbi:MAG: ABC transporter permease, partial [Anaerolineales bacterium]
MKKILNLAWNDIKIEFSDRSALLFFFILPLIFTAVLGASFSGNSDPSGENRWLVPIVDQDQSNLSADLVTELETSSLLRPEAYPLDEANDLLLEGEVVTVLIIPDGFETKVLSGTPVELELVQSPNDPNVLAVEQAIYKASGKVGNVVMVAINSVEAAASIKQFENEAARQAYFSQSLALA